MESWAAGVRTGRRSSLWQQATTNSGIFCAHQRGKEVHLSFLPREPISFPLSLSPSLFPLLLHAPGLSNPQFTFYIPPSLLLATPVKTFTPSSAWLLSYKGSFRSAQPSSTAAAGRGEICITPIGPLRRRFCIFAQHCAEGLVLRGRHVRRCCSPSPS